MITLKTHDSKPCGRSGWPTLVHKVYTLDNYPVYQVHVSYYIGCDVEPLTYVVVLKEGRQIGPAVHPYETQDIPTDGIVEMWFVDWMQTNKYKLI